MREIPKITLLIEPAYGVNRSMVRGIGRYARLRGPWSIHFTSVDYGQAVPRMKQWGSQGMIARIPNDTVARAVIESGVPTVALCLTDEQLQAAHPLSQLPDIAFDAAERVAELAAEHFFERGFRHFAFVGFDDVCWSRRREHAFIARLGNAGFEPFVYREPPRKSDRIWEREQPILTDWIRALPTPVGLLACNDRRGREVLEACRLGSLHVPQEIAVLGVDNDEVFCSVADPPLSSIALNSEAAGFQAAELLDQLMQGRRSSRQRVLVEAVGVVSRRSTEVTAVNDPDVAAALRFIRREFGNKISVDDIAGELAVSRRKLERRFRETIGRSILEEIQLVRVEHAKRLLLDTSYPVSKIAQLVGFGNADYFNRFFSKYVGKTPRYFRAELIVRRPDSASSESTS
jgi:LacI family transcriptional regulator